MELLQLRYFQALAKNQQLTKTATELMVSPPALSATISRLEKELGVSLFDRIGRSITLNENGKLFLNYIDHALTDIDNAISALQAPEKEFRPLPLQTPPQFLKSAYYSQFPDFPQ